MKSINALAKELARLEGKKSQARIHDIRELLGILSDMVYEDYMEDCQMSFWSLFLKNGERRAKRLNKVRSGGVK